MSKLKAAILPVTPLQQNCTIFWCSATNKAAIIDPGGEIPRILSLLEEEGLTLEKILLTHGHIDHAAGAPDLKDATGVPIIGPHKDDAFWLEHILEAGAAYGIPARKFIPDQWLEDGDEVQIGDLILKVLHCPGHTPGHIVFYHAASKLVQVGDVLFRGSVGRTDFPRSDHDALISSIQNKLFALGDDVTFISGHGPSGTLGEERKTNPFLI